MRVPTDVCTPQEDGANQRVWESVHPKKGKEGWCLANNMINDVLHII